MSPMTHLLPSLTVNLGIRAQLQVLPNGMERTSMGCWASHIPELGPAGKETGSWGRQIPPQGWRWCSSWLPAPSGEAGPALVLAPIGTMEVEDKGWIQTARQKMTSESAPYHRDWMLQLGCISPSHRSSTPASPSLFSPMCSTFRCLLVLRAELTALQQAVVSPHSLTLQGKSDMRSRWDIWRL